MTMPKSDANGVRYKGIINDAISFVFNIQTEPPNGRYTFNGLDSGFRKVQIQVNGQYIYTGENDTYYHEIAKSTFANSPLKRIQIPSSVTEIYEASFKSKTFYDF